MPEWLCEGLVGVVQMLKRELDCNLQIQPKHGAVHALTPLLCAGIGVEMAFELRQCIDAFHDGDVSNGDECDEHCRLLALTESALEACVLLLIVFEAVVTSSASNGDVE